jgi:hypothetical protein
LLLDEKFSIHRLLKLKAYQSPDYQETTMRAG